MDKVSKLVISSSLVQWNSSIANMDNSTTIVSCINDIFSLAQDLAMKGPSDPEIAKSIKSLKSIQSGLKGLFLASDSSYLLEKENISPN